MNTLQYWLLRFIAAGLARIPRRLDPSLFILLWPFYRLRCRSEVARVRAHLSAVNFKSTSVQQVYQALFYNGLDSLRFLLKRKSIEDQVQIVDRQLLQNILDEHKPVVVVSIHMGAFEMLHRVLAQFGQPVSLVTSHQNRPALERFLRKVRAVQNLHIVRPDEAPMLLRKLIRQQGIVAVMIDQSRTGKGNCVDLFGRPTYLWMRLALEACKEGASLVTVRTVRQGDAHIIKFETAYPGGSNPQILSAKLASEVERWIQENPTQWTWNYPRLWRID